MLAAREQRYAYERTSQPLRCRARGGGHPVITAVGGYWVPAFAGTTLGICSKLLRRLRRCRLLRRRDRPRCLDLGDLLGGVAEFLCENLLGVLAEQRRSLHLGDRVRHLHWIANREILSARRMVDLDDRAGVAQRRLLG